MGIRDTERLSKMIRSCNVQYFTLALLHRRKEEKKTCGHTIAGFFLLFEQTSNVPSL